MRVKQVEVVGLFGIFNHAIPLNLADRITIVHGPNGYGKTVMLGLINELFTPGYRMFRTVPFRQMSVDFDDGGQLTIVKPFRRQNDKGRSPILSITYRDCDGGTNRHQIKQSTSEDAQLPLAFVERAIPQLTRIAARRWVDLPTNEVLTLDDVLERYADVFPEVFPAGVIEPDPEWLSMLRAAIPVRFIKAQRLLAPVQMESRHWTSKEGKGRTSMRAAVSDYADDLSSEIKSTLSHYAEVSQGLDRSFPSRLMQRGAMISITQAGLQERLETLELRRAKLSEAGLLPEEQGLAMGLTPQSFDETTRDVLAVYVDDVEKKLSVFDDLAQRIELFREMVNGRFEYKQMKVSKESGLSFTTTEGSILSADSLSSGEQHEIVLLYELLFKVKPNSLILIDEPELSLHVGWQTEFLHDLDRITSVNQFDVLTATHASGIIHDRWDLTVRLQGPEKR